MKILKQKELALKEVSEASVITDEFLNFWLIQTRKQNLRLVGSEFFRLVESGDHEALKVFMADLFREWSENWKWKR